MRSNLESECGVMAESEERCDVGFCGSLSVAAP